MVSLSGFICLIKEAHFLLPSLTFSLFTEQQLKMFMVLCSQLCLPMSGFSTCTLIVQRSLFLAADLHSLFHITVCMQLQLPDHHTCSNMHTYTHTASHTLTRPSKPPATVPFQSNKSQLVSQDLRGMDVRPPDCRNLTIPSVIHSGYYYFLSFPFFAKKKRVGRESA